MKMTWFPQTTHINSILAFSHNRTTSIGNPKHKKKSNNPNNNSINNNNYKTALEYTGVYKNPQIAGYTKQVE